MTNFSNYQLTTPLDKKIFKKFLSDEITVKEAKVFSKQISRRFTYIVHAIANITGRKVHWFDYGNGGEEDHPGVFDTNTYSDKVEYLGDFSLKECGKRLECYDDSFPTSWFYTAFEAALQKEKETFLKQQQQLHEKAYSIKSKAQAELKLVQDRIKKKLTPEEFSYITFVSLADVAKNKAKVEKEIQIEFGKTIREMKNKGVDLSQKYKEYRAGKKRPQHFNLWVARFVRKYEEV